MDDDFNTGGAVGVLYELLTGSTASPTSGSWKTDRRDPKAKAEFDGGGVF